MSSFWNGGTLVGVISMSGKEIYRVGIIGRVAKREMRQKTAGER